MPLGRNTWPGLRRTADIPLIKASRKPEHTPWPVRRQAQKAPTATRRNRHHLGRYDSRCLIAGSGTGPLRRLNPYSRRTSPVEAAVEKPSTARCCRIPRRTRSGDTTEWTLVPPIPGRHRPCAYLADLLGSRWPDSTGPACVRGRRNRNTSYHAARPTTIRLYGASVGADIELLIAGLGRRCRQPRFAAAIGYRRRS